MTMMIDDDKVGYKDDEPKEIEVWALMVMIAFIWSTNDFIDKTHFLMASEYAYLNNVLWFEQHFLFILYHFGVSNIVTC